MPRRPDGRIEPGQKLASAISARAWNRAQDAADIVLGERTGFGAEGPQGLAAPFTSLPCKNMTATGVDRWGVLRISGVEITPTGPTGPATSQFQTLPVLKGNLPTTGTNDVFAVAVEPIPTNGIGRVAVDGLVQVKLDVLNEADATAGPKAGSVAELQTGGGNATIVWKESGTGAGKWALVRIGGRGMRLGTISSTWTKGQTATVTEQNGDGTARSGNPTFTARNWFADVTVSSGTKRVACQLVDSTWVLVAAECD
jgi:hypothetical protein